MRTEEDRIQNDARCARYGCNEEKQLQYKWRDVTTLPAEFDIIEAEAAILDAFTRQGGAHVWSGDGSSCAAQIVQAAWRRGESERAALADALRRLLDAATRDSPEAREKRAKARELAYAALALHDALK